MTTPEAPHIVQKISQSYDDLPYSSNPFPQTHPDNLRTICSLFDVATPAPETASVLEIGCSFGGNILPIAQQYPQANITGLDLSARQIAIGKTAIRAMGLSNIQLLHQDITTYDVPEKTFDYIICHGVYSWVPEPVRQSIFRVISKGLKTNGAAIVSYNTYPGWKFKEIYRDSMLFRSRFVDNVRDKIMYGMGMLDFLKENLPETSPLKVSLDGHHADITQANTSYIAHEYLEQINEPCYFHEFMEQAHSVGLRFAAEADFQNHFFSPVSLSREKHDALKREANGDIIRLEQLYDYLSDRSFRQTILIHSSNSRKSSVGKDSIDFATLEDLHIQGSFAREKTPENGKENPNHHWRPLSHATSVLFRSTPETDFIFSCLNSTNGQTLSVRELWKRAEDSADGIEKMAFFRNITELITRKAVRARRSPVTWSDVTDSKHPRLSNTTLKLFRWIQKNPDTIGLTTAFHQALSLDPVAKELLALLDGRHSRQDLYSRLIEAVSAGRLTFSDASQNTLTDSESIAAAAQEHTDRLLDVLEHNGLLE